MERLTENGLIEREELDGILDNPNDFMEMIVAWYEKLAMVEDLESEIGIKFTDLCALLKKNKRLLYYNKENKQWLIRQIYEQTIFPAEESIQ